MAEQFDFFLDDQLNMQIQNGDFVTGPADFQNMQLIALSSPGDWKQNPYIGARLIDYMNGPASQQQDFVKQLKLQLRLDGYRIRKVDVSQGIENFKVTAER